MFIITGHVVFSRSWKALCLHTCRLPNCYYRGQISFVIKRNNYSEACSFQQQPVINSNAQKWRSYKFLRGGMRRRKQYLSWVEFMRAVSQKCKPRLPTHSETSTIAASPSVWLEWPEGCHPEDSSRSRGDDGGDVHHQGKV